MEEAQLQLRDTPGVTVLIYDQECAANLRRKRKRGHAADPACASSLTKPSAKAVAIAATSPIA